MTLKKGSLIKVTGGTAVLLVVLVAIWLIINRPYTGNIPDIPESHAFPGPVLEQITGARAKARRNPSAGNLGMLGMVYHASADYENAARCYRLAVERDETDWIWHYYLGYLHLEMGESEEVIRDFNRVIELNPEAKHAWYYGGEAHMNLMKYDEAEDYFSKLSNETDIPPAGDQTTRRDHFPLSTYAMFRLSNVYKNSGRVELAEKTLKEIISGQRTFGPAYRLLGNINRTGGNTALGDQLIASANDLTVFSPPVDTLVDRLALLSRSDRYLPKKIDEAYYGIYPEWTLALVDHSMQTMPDNKFVTFKAIRAYLWMDMDQQAISHTDRHISLSQNDFSELYKTAMLFYKKELYDVSKKYLLRTLGLKPGEYEIQKRLARSYWFTGETQKAMDLFNEILAGHPDDLEILSEVMDMLFFDLGERENSVRYFEILNLMQPTNPKALKVAGQLAAEEGKIPDAIALYESSFRGDPGDLVTIRNLGQLLSRQSMWERSVQFYREALSMHPNEPEILERLGVILIVCPDPAVRNVTEGVAFAERVLLNVESKPLLKISSYRVISMSFAMMGDLQNAMKSINMAIKIARDEKYPPERVGELESLLKRYQGMK